MTVRKVNINHGRVCKGLYHIIILEMTDLFIQSYISPVDKKLVGPAGEQEREATKAEGNCMGINKGGLVSNNQNHGQTEVLDVTDNIYYESADIVDKKEKLDEIQKRKRWIDVNKDGLVSNNHNHGETEVIDLTDNIYYESVDLHAIPKWMWYPWIFSYVFGGFDTISPQFYINAFLSN